jgi:uncharacterized spore protein YtfJ
MSKARDAISVKRVFGDPYEKNGVTVIPAARVWGGAGAGEGEGQDGESAGSGKGSGSGFGFRGSPAGVYVIREDKVQWQPAVDPNRLVLGFQVVIVVAILTRWLIRRRAST